MSLENPFLHTTSLTSTNNIYLSENERFCSTGLQKIYHNRKQLRSLIQPDYEFLNPKRRRAVLFDVENKFLKQSTSDIRRKKKKKKAVPFSRAVFAECYLPQYDSFADNLDCLDSSTTYDRCENELNMTERLAMDACGFGGSALSVNAFGFSASAPSANTFGFGASAPLGNALIFGAPAPPGNALTFCASAPPGNSRAFGASAPSGPLFGSDGSVAPAISVFQKRSAHLMRSSTQLQQQPTNLQLTRHTEFSSVHGMPVYHFKEMEITEIFEPTFHSLDIDSELIKLQKVKSMKFKKMQLLNATSMALVYSPNFKDPNDSFRIFLLNCADHVMKFDPEFILKVALYARQELHIRSASNFLLSYSAFNTATRPYLKKYFEASIVLPTDWLDVAEQYLIFQDTRLASRSLPSALKQVLKTTFLKFDEYQLAKYNRKKVQSKVGKASSLESSEKRPSKDLKTFTIKQLIRLLHITSPVNYVMCILGKKYPTNSTMFQNSGLPGMWDSKKAGHRMKLPQPATWETKVSCEGNKAEVWENLIDNSKLPYMATIRNLKNLIISGISEKHHEKVLNYLENKNAVIKSKQFPIQFFTAFKVIDDIEKLQYYESSPCTSQSGVEASTKWKKKRLEILAEKVQNVDPSILERYKISISNAVEISAINNIIPIPGITLLICDVTNSAQNADDEDPVITASEKKAYENCLIMGLMCLRACEDCKMKVIYGLDSIETVHVKDEPFLQTVSDLCEKVQNYTKPRHQKTSQFVKSLQMMLEQFLKTQTRQTLKLDHVIIFRGNSCINIELMKSVTEPFLNKYRHTINPNLLYTQVDLAISDRRYPDLSSATGEDIYLCGFSSQILKFIAERSDGGQLSYVDNIDEKYKLSNDLINEQALKESTDVSEELLNAPLYTILPKWHTAQIFISSTFKDMHAERDLIIRYVIPELKVRAASIFVKINEVDLRWGITESDCATKRVAELCLLEAERSDLLIGILGERYGSIYDFDAPDNPQLTWVNDYPSGSSITELELYAGALKDPVRKSSKAFFYFRDPTFLSFVPKIWKNHFECEDQKSGVKLKNLKERIRKSGFKVLDNYPCYYAGIVKNNPLVAGLDTFGEEVLEDTWKAVKAMHENEPSINEITEEDFNQNDIFEVHKHFFGEKNSQMEQFISMMKKEKGIFVLCGSSGCGKSSFVIHMLKKIEDSSIIKFFIGVSPRSTDVSFMLQYIANTILRQFPVSTVFPSINEDIINQFPDILLEAVKACRTNTFTLIIDGLDHLDLNDQGLDWLPLDVPKGMNILCTASDASLAFKVLCERKKCGSPIFIQDLPPLQLPEREQLVRNHLQTYGKTLDESPFNNQMMQLVTKRDSGSPLYLQIACEYLRKFAVFDNLMSTLQSFPSSLSHVLEEIIVQLESEYGSVFVQTALTLLSISKEGLEENEFYLLLSFALLHVDTKSGISQEELVNQLQLMQPDDFLPQVKFRSFLHLLCTFVYGHNSSKSFSLTSEEEKVVQKYYLNKNYGRVVKYLHPALGAYYKTVCDPKKDGSWNGYSSSSFRSLLYHLYCGMCYNELAEILCCNNFIEAAFKNKIADQLLEYFNLILNDNNLLSSASCKEINFQKLDCYYNFISRNAHILYCSPHLLFQQALNEPFDSLTYLRTSEIKISSFECLSRSSITDFRHHTLSGFLKNVVSVAFQKGKSLAVFGTDDGYLKVFDRSSKKITKSFKAHLSTITFICCFGKNQLCTASTDNSLCIWDNVDYNRIAILKGHQHYVTGCCSDPSGSALFSSAWDNTVRIWSPVDGRQISIIDDFRCPVNCIDHHPEQQAIACGLWNGNVEIWDTLSLKRKLVLEGHSGSIKSVIYIPDGINILSSSINSEVLIWSSTEGLKVACLSGHFQPVKSISCSKANDIIVTAGEDCTLKVWPNNTKHSAATLSQCKFCSIRFMEFIQTSTLVIAFQNSDVWIVDIHDGHIISSFDSKLDPATCFSKLNLIDTEAIDISVKKYGTSLIFGTLSGKIMALDFTSSTPEIVGTINAKVTALVHSLSIILCGSDNGDVGVFSLTDVNYSRIIFGAHAGSITTLSFALIDESLNALSASTDKTLKLWSITTEEIDLSLKDTYTSKHKDYITCCNFFKAKSAGENYVGMLTGSHDNNVIMWDSTDQKILNILQTSVVNVFYSKSYVVGCASDGSISVWSHDGKLISFIKSIEKSSTALAFGFREDTIGLNEFDIDLAYVDSDGSVLIKHPIQRTQLCSLEGHNMTITSCCSEENGEIISCSLDGTVNMWKIPFEFPDLSLKHSGEITGIALSSCCSVAVSSDTHGNIVLWKIDSLSQEHSIIYLATKSFSGGCVKDVIWLKERTFLCALNHKHDDIETYILKEMTYEYTTSDEKDSYIIREVNTYYTDSEVLDLDFNEENQCIAASLKSGHVSLIAPNFHETRFVVNDWVLAAAFSHGNSSILCTADPKGVIQCYSLSNVLNKISDLPCKTLESADSLDNPCYITALNCNNTTIIYTGNSRGWLNCFSDNWHASKPKFSKQAHATTISSICVFGTNVFTSSFDKTIKGWNALTLAQVSQFHAMVPITCLAVPKDNANSCNNTSNNHILVFGTRTGDVHLLMYHSKT